MLANRHGRTIRISYINHFFLNLNLSAFPGSISSKSSFSSSRFLVHCNSQISENGRSGKIEEAERVFNCMPTKNVVSWTAMLTAYADNGQIAKARKVFDEMPERTVASWNAMITAYIRSRAGIVDATELFLQMTDKNAVSYAAMITGYVRAGRLASAEKLYYGMRLDWRDPVCSNALMNGYLKEGKLEKAVGIFEGMVEKNVVSWSAMVDGYCKMGLIGEARTLFDATQERNAVTWTAMINGYMKTDCFAEGFKLFLRMRYENVVKAVPNTLTVIFEACGRFGRDREGSQVHALAMSMGFDFDTFLGNSVITMYCRLGYLDAAFNLFQTMERKDIVTWNSLIGGYVQAEQIEEAYRHFKIMPHKDVVSWTTMISGFSSKGLTEKSVELFNMMPEKDDVAWTALISGFVVNGEYEESLCWFIRMLQNEVRPNPLTLSSVLSASAGLATLVQGQQIHCHALKKDMAFDLSIQNSLISMYSKCGCVSEAYRIFQSISSPDIVSFNSMVTGFAQNGFGQNALALFTEMKCRGHQPNEITFLGVLSACTHAGHVEEGWNYFRMMRSIYKIEPGPDHYACMVDLLGRAGFLDKAIDLINLMPFEAHSGVWGALLGASRTHLRLDLAKIAAEHILLLEPNNATPYVVLSDMYLISGKKEDEIQIRITKKSKGIKKNPGCSWIMLKDNVNMFLSGDQSHRNFDDIIRTLWTIMDDMKHLDSNMYIRIRETIHC